MYSDTNLARLKDIQNRIHIIFDICKERGGIVVSLSDYKIAQPAIIMHLIVCNENLQKLQDEINVLEFFSSEDIKGLKAIRNIASHNYDGLNLVIIENVIRDFLPRIDEKLEKFLRELK